MNEIKIGDTIYIDGEEYIVRTTKLYKDSLGKSLEILCKDPVVAAYEKEQTAKQKQMIEQCLEELRKANG